MKDLHGFQLGLQVSAPVETVLPCQGSEERLKVGCSFKQVADSVVIAYHDFWFQVSIHVRLLLSSAGCTGSSTTHHGVSVGSDGM